ncbi:MAG: MATE family efflux transporter [Pseudomonadota bacterium]
MPNLLAGWLAFTASAIIGFVMPRLILGNVGQDLLGLWDLCWSFLTFISFAGIGTGSAVSHLTVKADAHGNAAVAREVISTGFYLQLLIGILLSSIVYWVIQWLPTMDLSSHHASEQIYLLGLYVAGTVMVAILGEIPHGILLSKHQLRQSEYLNIAHDVSLAFSMIATLSFGGGIVGLALVTLIVRCVFEAIRFGLAFTQTPLDALNPQRMSRERAVHMLRFSFKSSLYGLQELVVYQTIRVSFFLAMGPAVFAAFSRYSTLARQINRLIDRLVTPIPILTSDYSSQGNAKEIRDVYLYGLRGIWMVALPTLGLLGVFGDQIVLLWMGENFVVPNLAWVFCVACMLHSHYSMSAKILRGINAHGSISALCLLASTICLISLVLTNYPLTATSAAWSIALSMILCVHIPHVVFCWRKLEIQVLGNILTTYVKPLLINVIFLMILVQIEDELTLSNWTLVVVYGATGLLTLGLGYWYLAFDSRMREKFRGFLLSSEVA